MRKSFLLLMVLIAVSPDLINAGERLKFGGNGNAWDETGLYLNALEVTQLEGLSPLEADPNENILPRIRELGGGATTSVTTAAARSNQIINELIDGDYKTGWRVYTNTNGAELTVDMGAIFSLQRIFFRRGVLNDDERSLRGYEFYVNNGDPLNFVGENPVYSLIAQNRSHGLPELDLNFPATQVRYFKLRSTGEKAFQMGDLEVFGIGVTPFAHYISRVIDLGADANFGPVQVYTRTDSLAKTLFSTKTGTTADDSLYFRQTGIPGQFEEVPRNEFDRTLDPAYAGIIRANDRDWSSWSPPYAKLTNSPLNSPDNRRYVQFEFKLLSGSLLDKALVDSVIFNYSIPAIADSIVGEITPNRGQIGEINEFTYHLRSVSSSGDKGFDTVFINTPFDATATKVEVDGQAINTFDSEMAGGQLKVSFSENRITRTGQRVDITFRSLLTFSGTEFRSEVGISNSDSYPQRVIAGDAHPESEGNTLTVGAIIEDKLFGGVNFSSEIVTPNADGVNDILDLDYILLKATDPVRVTVIVYNLSGDEIARVYDRYDVSGPNQVIWEGRDAEGKIVSPGLYVVCLKADADAGDAVKFRTIAIAY
ncbi:MAG: discoidin domain-containing protein [Candidatus Latescibacterota bacterium]|nr:discoidin domain-containing protein [Candidatus Latescibacterota bacterium]